MFVRRIADELFTIPLNKILKAEVLGCNNIALVSHAFEKIVFVLNVLSPTKPIRNVSASAFSLIREIVYDNTYSPSSASIVGEMKEVLIVLESSRTDSSLDSSAKYGMPFFRHSVFPSGLPPIIMLTP